MAGPQNAIIGDDYGTDIPEMKIDKGELDDEKKAAKYSKSAEYKHFKNRMEEKIKFVQNYLPDGTPVAALVSNELRGQRWEVANEVIHHLKEVMGYYDDAEATIKAKEGKQ